MCNKIIFCCYKNCKCQNENPTRLENVPYTVTK